MKNNIDNLSLPIELDSNFVDNLRNYNSLNKINKINYREKMDNLYNNLKDIKPLDNINDVLYFDNYNELGISIEEPHISLKQIWTEYRLIYNEYQKEGDNIMENSFVLDNFDILYDKLNKKVEGFDKYINELNSLKKEIDTDNDNIKIEKEELKQAQKDFENYKLQEIEKLNKRELEIANKLNRVNDLIKKLDEKMQELN